MHEFIVCYQIKYFEDELSSFFFAGTCIVSGSEDHTVIVWSLHTFSKLHTIKVHSDAVTSVKLKVRG